MRTCVSGGMILVTFPPSYSFGVVLSNLVYLFITFYVSMEMYRSF